MTLKRELHDKRAAAKPAKRHSRWRRLKVSFRRARRAQSRRR